MNDKEKTKEELQNELMALQNEFYSLSSSIIGSDTDKYVQLEQKLALALQISASQDEIIKKQDAELNIALQNFVVQNEEMRKRAVELVIANKELIIQNKEKEKRTAELIDVNKELIFQNREREKRAAELVIANEELVFQNIEKKVKEVENIEIQSLLAEKEKQREVLIQSLLEIQSQSEEIAAHNEKLAQSNKELKIAMERAEESDELKSIFLANISHEIRTPMNSMLGFVKLLKEPNLSLEEKSEFLIYIESSGIQLLNIFNDILNISKVELGKMEVSVNATDINDQIDFIYSAFRSEANQKGIKLIFKKSLTAKWAYINTDREKLRAILTNLVNNALKFIVSGTIEFGYNLKCNRVHSELEFFVKDTGIGINKEQSEFIFNRFRQGSESLKRNYDGVGLGLSIAKAYVEMLGGKIWVESKEGNGSIFYFTLPYNTKCKSLAKTG